MTDQSASTYLLLQQRKAGTVFIWMMAVSLLLHFACSFLFMLPGRFSGGVAQPVFVELAQLPVAASPEPAGEAEEPLPQAAPETLPAVVPDSAPETTRLNQAIASTLQQAAVTPAKVHESSIGLGMTSGYFGSFAEGETLREEIREYYFSLMRRINETWWLNAGPSPRLGRGAAINIVITREGKIAAVRIIEGSGDADYDRLLLEALKKAEPLPPLPPDFPVRQFSAPIRFIPPLGLMLPQFSRKTALPGLN